MSMTHRKARDAGDYLRVTEQASRMLAMRGVGGMQQAISGCSLSAKVETVERIREALLLDLGLESCWEVNLDQKISEQSVC